MKTFKTFQLENLFTQIAVHSAMICFMVLLINPHAFTQKVGINTLTPEQQLHVKGNVKVDSALIIGSTMGNIAGSMRYNSINNRFEGYNGTEWQALDFGASDQAWIDSLSYLYRTSARVGIGTANPDTSAILDLSSSNQGFLLPRMTLPQRNAIVNPANGLQIYNIDDGCIDVYFFDTWKKNCFSTVGEANSWTQKSDVGMQDRNNAVGFSINGKGYIGTGTHAVTKFKDFWEYDPSTDVWTQKADFGGTARDGAVGFSINGKGYIGTGDDGGMTNDFWEYDPATDVWTQKADFGGTARRYAVGFGLNGKGYIGTGDDGSRRKDFWEYDPVTDVWTQKADLGGVTRFFAVGFSIGDKGYIGTGQDTQRKKDFWEYDPATDVWTQKTDLAGVARFGGVGFSLNGKGYIGTGYFNGYLDDFWMYDPATDTWTQKLNYGGQPRYLAVGFSVLNKGYLGTGNPGDGKEFWQYEDQLLVDWKSKQTDVYFDAGNVGIGTSSPSHMLDVAGTGRFEDNVIIEGNTSVLGASTFEDDVDCLEDVTISGALDVGSTSQFTGAATFSNSLNVNGISNFYADATFAYGAVFNEFGLLQNNFRIESVHNSHMFYLNSSTSNIGINRSNPSKTLDVFGSALFEIPSSPYTFTVATSSDSHLFHVTPTNKIGISKSNPQATLDVDGSGIFNLAAGGSHDFRVASNSNPNMFFVNGANNSIGIGTSLPFETLDVNGSAKFNLTNSSSRKFSIADGADILVVNGTTQRVGIGTTNPSAVLEVDGDAIFDVTGANGFQVNTGLPNMLFVHPTLQRVGIATGSPSATLDINGTLQVDGIATFDGSVVVNESGSSSTNFRVESNAYDHMLFVDAGTSQVGIGKYPTTTLDVNGEIKNKIGTQTLNVPGGQESLRILRGTITSSGSIDAGTGFTAVKTSVGDYDVAFLQDFSSRPTVVVSISDSYTGSVADDNIANLYSVSKFGFSVNIKDAVGSNQGDDEDAWFTFIVMGL